MNDDDLTEIIEHTQIHEKDENAISKNESVLPTQLDMEEAHAATEPAAKRRKLDMEAEHEDEEKLSVDEHGSFVQVLQSILKVVKSNFQALCTILIKNENFEKLQVLTVHAGCVETFVDGSATTPREDAYQSATALVELFAEYMEAEDIVFNLQEWRMETLPRLMECVSQELLTSVADTMGQAFHKLLKVWEEGWQEQKQKMLKEEDYTALSHLKAIKEKLETWASQEAPPTEQEVLRELGELKSNPTIKEWHEMESLLLTTEELMNAGMRQQNLHLFNGMPVDLTNDLQGTESTVATTC